MKLFANMTSVDQIDLPEIEPGFWIKVRKELSVGEKRQIFTDAFKGQTQLPDGTTRTEYNAMALTFGLTCAHITDWNATQERDGKVVSVPFTTDAIKGLSSEAYDVIEKAVDKYVEKAKAELAGEAEPAQRSNVAPISFSAAG